MISVSICAPRCHKQFLPFCGWLIILGAVTDFAKNIMAKLINCACPSNTFAKLYGILINLAAIITHEDAKGHLYLEKHCAS